MTPTHPPHPSTHRRIADILERAPTSAPSLATALDLTPATIGAALAKMTELGYVAKGDTQSRTIGHGRPTQLWQLAPGAVVPSDSGSCATSTPLNPATYVARIVDTLRTGPATRDELLRATRMGSTQLGCVLTHLAAEGSISATPRKSRGRPGFLYALVREPVDPGAVEIKKYVNPHANRKKPPTDEEAIEFEGTVGTFSFGFIAGTETAPCAREPRTVSLAACIDGYVDATATGRQSPCNQCPTGRARRADYAGADFGDGDDE